MSIALVITDGFGNGNLAGDINNIITMGYSIGVCTPTQWSNEAAAATTWAAESVPGTTWADESPQSTAWSDVPEC